MKAKAYIIAFLHVSTENKDNQHLYLIFIHIEFLVPLVMAFMI